MAKILITPDHDLASLVPEGTEAYEATGEDRITMEPTEAGFLAMQTKSARLPLHLVEAAEEYGHPQGFSGIMRDALTEWVAKHTGTASEAADVQQALAVLQRAAAHWEQYEKAA